MEPQTKKAEFFDSFIRNPSVIWYGPHECNGCGEMIVRSSVESGGLTLDAPHSHNYPNHQWQAHNCGPKVDTGFRFGPEVVFDAPPTPPYTLEEQIRRAIFDHGWGK